MINKIDSKEELLKQLKQYDYYEVNHNIDFQNEKKKAIVQTSIYHNVTLHWNGSVFKFWNKKSEDVKMFLNSNINFEKSTWENHTVMIYIHDCDEVIKVRCCKY